MFKAVLGRLWGCMTFQTLNFITANLMVFQAYLHVFLISPSGTIVFLRYRLSLWQLHTYLLLKCLCWSRSTWKSVKSNYLGIGSLCLNSSESWKVYSAASNQCDVRYVLDQDSMVTWLVSYIPSFSNYSPLDRGHLEFLHTSVPLHWYQLCLLTILVSWKLSLVTKKNTNEYF